MNQHTAKEIHRLIVATSAGNTPAQTRQRHRAMKRAWTATPWNQRHVLMNAMHNAAAVATESAASVVASTSTADQA